MQTFSAELHVSGRVGTQKLRATVLAGITAAGAIRLEMPAPFGRPVFVLAGTTNRATLVTRDNHVVTARADEILQALTGLPFEPRALMAVLSGCGVVDDVVRDARRYDTALAVDTGDGRVFLRQTNGRWRIAAAETRGLTAGYELADDAWPRSVRVSSDASHSTEIALTVAERQVEANGQIAASAFAVSVPAGATALTIEDLRASGPLGQNRD
jgi:hypothetical protein